MRLLFYFAAIVTLGFFSCSLLTAKEISMQKNKNIAGDYVVLLHGIGRSSQHMQTLEAHLQYAGYDVINLDYPSTDYPLEKLTDIIHSSLEKELSQNKTTHFVGYSMGGILVRTLLNKYPLTKQGRVVLLATPNQGSEVADFLKNNRLYKKLYGPAGQQLTTDQKNIRNLLGQVNYEVGVISGNRTIDPFSSYIIPGKDDGKVSIKSTYLEHMQDQITIPATHTFFPKNKAVMQQTAYFLQHGKFSR